METINTTSAYLITCMTNVHAGSGDANFGVIDNLVQRDSISRMPEINASSLKGALREYCNYVWRDDESQKNERINHIFGPDPSRNKNDSPAKGNFKFFNADLLTLPVPSNKKPFFRAVSPYIVEEIKAKGELMGCQVKLPDFSHNEDQPLIRSGSDVKVDDYTAKTDASIPQSDGLLGDNISLFSNDKFKQLTKKLPFVARNKLNNGISENLWYEEIVPRETRFVFFVQKQGKYQKEFDEILESGLVQVGANATVGMGYVKIRKIEENE